MQTFIAATIIALIASTTAAPTQNLAARAPGDVTICTGENYTGECTTLSVPFYDCYHLEAPYLNNVGSFKVDAGAYCRITYTAENCTMHGDAFIWPDTNAPTLHHFDDPATQENIDAGSTMTSFLCQECTNCNA
ncbi:hypothetical protein BU26DRAFT_522981 [Trematosphaeria pertusa]|uniref:Uncharacterized protein n=1 Tax=Trematosphaeria pertusa TaxID=390896 RepID=A0A6A6I2W3_9PLEO|nr:uncharacterized protein BU26DRAFT_522981 [Trematosphaeria pertusa]KAF2244312.1 hypothetical protein BU26DRAFT_522981 [Trematosphaeria pertusa]